MIPFNPLQFHHLYWGAISVGFCAWLLFSGRWPEPQGWGILWNVMLGWLAFGGLVAIVDDCNQHWGNGNSPLNRLFHVAWACVFGAWWPFGRA
jgi:hypothetical protein